MLYNLTSFFYSASSWRHLAGSVAQMKLLRTLRCQKALVLCLLLLSTCCSAVPHPKAAWVRGARPRLAKSSHIIGKRWLNESTCAQTGPAAIQPGKGNIWVGLTDDEAAGVTEWLFGQKDLNLSLSAAAGEWDNTVLLVELMQPNKSDALAYIDGSSAAPLRYAHVVLDVRATLAPTYTDILVGPLPVQNGTTTWQPLEYPYTNNAGGKVRNTDADEDTRHAWVLNITGSISDITLDLWGGVAKGLDNDTLDVWGIDPLWQDDGKLIYWATFWNLPVDQFDAETLLPLGLFLKADITGRDPSQWKLEGWLYNDIYYPTTEAFRKAFASPNFIRLGANVEGSWATTDQHGDPLPMDSFSPPVVTAPGGSRYALDPESKYVEWMDFIFTLALPVIAAWHSSTSVIEARGFSTSLVYKKLWHTTQATILCRVVQAILTATMALDHTLFNWFPVTIVLPMLRMSIHRFILMKRPTRTSTPSASLSLMRTFRYSDIPLATMCLSLRMYTSQFALYQRSETTTSELI